MILTNQRVEKSGDITTTSTTYVDTTGMTLTLANRAGGKFFAQHIANGSNSNQERNITTRFVEGITNHEGLTYKSYDINTNVNIDGTVGNPLSGDLDGDALKIQWKVNSDTGSYYGVSDRFSHMEVIEIS